MSRNDSLSDAIQAGNVAAEADQATGASALKLAPPGRLSQYWRTARTFVLSQMALLLLIVLLLAGGLLSDVFFTPANLLNVLWATSILGIVALGQTLLLITRNFDMSVRYVVPFAGIVTIGLQIAGWSLIPSLLGGILTGIGVGLVNGAIVVLTRANPFLITLGTQTLVYSIALTLTEAKTWYATIPEFNILGRGKLFGQVAYSVVIFVVLAIALEFILRRTRYGRSLYAIGLNEEAARLSGIAVQRIKLITFALTGLLAGLGGLVMSSRLNSTNASGAVGMDFDSIIVVVLGGTSLFGGFGGTLRTVVGVLVLGILNNLMVLIAVPYEAQWMAKGTVFLLVVGLDTYARRLRAAR
jgi:ribose transport system permease protein